MTLLNMVSFMMFFKNVKLMFWGDTILCVVYLRNKSTLHALDDKTPYEMWYGHIPLVTHLMVFGSTCYALILKEQRNKFMQGIEVHLLGVLKYHKGISFV